MTLFGARPSIINGKNAEMMISWKKGKLDNKIKECGNERTAMKMNFEIPMPPPLLPLDQFIHSNILRANQFEESASICCTASLLIGRIDLHSSRARVCVYVYVCVLRRAR